MSTPGATYGPSARSRAGRWLVAVVAGLWLAALAVPPSVTAARGGAGDPVVAQVIHASGSAARMVAEGARLAQPGSQLRLAGVAGALPTLEIGLVLLLLLIQRRTSSRTAPGIAVLPWTGRAPPLHS